MALTTFRLIYISRSLIPAEETRRYEIELDSLVAEARWNNKRAGITGALLIADDRFVQLLEGEEQPVQRLFDDIAEDARHTDLQLIDERRTDERTFGDSPMARISDDDRADIPLLANRERMTAGRRAAPSTTADQELVLDYMRNAARQVY